MIPTASSAMMPAHAGTIPATAKALTTSAMVATAATSSLLIACPSSTMWDRPPYRQLSYCRSVRVVIRIGHIGGTGPIRSAEVPLVATEDAGYFAGERGPAFSFATPKVTGGGMADNPLLVGG